MADGRSRSLGLLVEATEWRALAPGWGACVDETCPFPRLLPTGSASHLPAVPGYFTVGVILSSAQSNRHSLKAKCGGRWMWWGQGIEGCEKDFLIPQIELFRRTCLVGRTFISRGINKVGKILHFHSFQQE